MLNPVQAVRTVGQGSVLAYADFKAFYTWRTWLGGWLVRLLCQVAFFSLIGRMVGDSGYVAFVVVGAAMTICASEPMQAVASTTWDRNFGTISLLAASPVEPGFFYLGRSLQWPLSGTATTMIALLVMPPLFGLGWAAADLPVLLVLVLITAFSSYCVAMLFGAIALVAPGARNVILNIVISSTTCLTGALVPVDFWPQPVQWAVQTIPLTHGLQAVRHWQGDTGLGAVIGSASLTMLAGVAWFIVAFVAFRRIFAHSRQGTSLIA
ncbi:MAG: ABC transporter permease [Acidimicrobiales bacterium]